MHFDINSNNSYNLISQWWSVKCDVLVLLHGRQLTHNTSSWQNSDLKEFELGTEYCNFERWRQISCTLEELRANFTMKISIVCKKELTLLWTKTFHCSAYKWPVKMGIEQITMFSFEPLLTFCVFLISNFRTKSEDKFPFNLTCSNWMLASHP